MKNFIILSIIILAGILISCTKDNNIVSPSVPLTIQKIKLAEGYAAGTKVELYANDTLCTGYNRFYIRILDSATNSVVRDARLLITPIMDMGSMKHSCPTEQTQSERITNDLFPVAAIFTMAGTTMNKWSVRIEFHNYSTDRESEVTLPIPVVDGSFPPKTFMGTDGKAMILTMLPFSKPVVGMNDVEFAVFTNTSGVYSPIDDLTMAITPEMPSMGHGSPNNVNPTSNGKGHYIGKVNYIMTGEWKINLSLKRNSVTVTEQFFMITL